MMRRLRMGRILLGVIGILTLIAPITTRAQGIDVDGYGIVRFMAYISPSSPFTRTCGSNVTCVSMQKLLFPQLFEIELGTGRLLMASESDLALIESISGELPAETVTLTLRQDRVWSDGEPMTAYDVLFSLIQSHQLYENIIFPFYGEIAGISIADEYTLVLRFAASNAETEAVNVEAGAVTPTLAPTCDDLPRSNTFVFAAHATEPRFRQFVDQDAPPGETPNFSAWYEAYQEQSLTGMRAVYETPSQTVTSGDYLYVGTNVEGIGRFIPADGVGAAIEWVYVDPVSAFIAEDTQVLFDVPFNQRANLSALSNPDVRGVQIAELPGRESLIVLFNFGDPRRPLPAFHPETGESVDQGEHPIFNDIRIRRALQLAIDPEPIIDGALQGSAQRLAGLLSPASWAYDETLPQRETNIAAAIRLLDEAGWFDTDGNGVRECVSCTTAPIGTPLNFTLGLPSENDIYEIANTLIREWSRVGVSVYTIGQGEFLNQVFDAALIAIDDERDFENDPDRSHLLTPEYDVLEPYSIRGLGNFGSYNNPEVNALVEAARTVPGCNPAERAEIYAELERVLQADLPFLTVAAPNEFYAAARGVNGFAPRVGDPLWNIESWRVTP